MRVPYGVQPHAYIKGVPGVKVLREWSETSGELGWLEFEYRGQTYRLLDWIGQQPTRIQGGME